MVDLTGKIALVTGASRGIGEAIALSLGGAGACVIGTATSDSRADAISTKLGDSGITGTGMRLDVVDKEQIAELIKNITNTYGDIDILINNAGITRDNLLIRMKEEEWDAIINTNLTSVYKMSKTVLRGMIKKRAGRIISITSVVGAMGNAGQANYAAAKAGIMGFSKSLAQEVGNRGITVNTVAPGFIKTAMTDALPEAQKMALAEKIPLGRLGCVDEVASVVLFLASDASAYITAQTIHVNGGMYTV